MSEIATVKERTGDNSRDNKEEGIEGSDPCDC